MFIELLVVAVVISLLYSSGFVRFDSGYAVAISLLAVLPAVVLSWFVTHYFARRFVDQMFGFDSWSPRGTKKVGLTGQEMASLERETEPELRNLTKKYPVDPELSRRVSEIYLQRGRTDLFVAERLRLVETGTLSREQVCAVFNRLADVEQRGGRRAEAVQFLQQVVIRYPRTVEAGNAQRRCELLEAGEDEQIVSEPKA